MSTNSAKQRGIQLANKLAGWLTSKHAAAVMRKWRNQDGGFGVDNTRQFFSHVEGSGLLSVEQSRELEEIREFGLDVHWALLGEKLNVMTPKQRWKRTR